MSKEKKTTLIRAAVLIVVLIAGYFIYKAYRYEESDDAYVQAPVLMLSARIGGTVQKVLVKENEKVRAGQLLAVIDEQDYSAAYNQTLADVAALQADYRQAYLDYQRVDQLFQEKAVTKQQFDAAVAHANGLSHRLKAAQYKADQSKMNLGYTQITAPDEGSIAKKSIEPGMVIPPGQALFGFVSSKDRWVTVNLKETQLARVQPGQKVEVTVDAIKHQNFKGEVDSISSSTGSTFTLLPPDNSTGNFTKVVQRVPVRIKLLNLTPEDIDHLAAGLSAVVAIKIH